MFIMAPSYGARYLFTCPLGERLSPDPTRTRATCSGNATLACFEDVQRVAGGRKGAEKSAKCARGVGGLPHGTDGDARRKFEFNP